MTKKRPNVIWFIADQMRAQAMAHRGDPNVRTPNLDNMAAEGISFVNAISGAPLCSPFRGSLVTGQYPHKSTVPGHDYPLAVKMPTIAHAFKDAGYRTCWVGKWHLDGNRPELDLKKEENRGRYRQIPPERRGGFEDWVAYENNNQPFNCRVHTDKDGETVSFRLPGYETDSLTDILLDWLKGRVQNQPDQPFFAVLSVQPPHTPYVAPPENMAHYNPATLQLRPNVPQVNWVQERVRRELAGYYAAIERVDWNLGRIRTALQEMAIDEDTFIIFFSDHGDMHGSQGQFWKTNPWEESIRIPFIVQVPGRSFQIAIEPQALINHVDIAPTTLGLCGISKPDYMVGRDYSPLIMKYQPAFDVPLHDQSNLEMADSAYLSIPVATHHPDSIDKAWRGIVTRDGWKYTILDGQSWLMYNLNDDPYEQVNLAHNPWFGRKRKQLQERLTHWLNDTDDT
jgi:arylsulfatase A-like enzyme